MCKFLSSVASLLYVWLCEWLHLTTLVLYLHSLHYEILHQPSKFAECIYLSCASVLPSGGQSQQHNFLDLCPGDLVNVLPVVGDVTGHWGRRHGGIHVHLGPINVCSWSAMKDLSRWELEWTFKPVCLRSFGHQNDVGFRDICIGPEGEGKDLFTVKETHWCPSVFTKKTQNHRKTGNSANLSFLRRFVFVIRTIKRRSVGVVKN